jgi:hypothetical protein
VPVAIGTLLLVLQVVIAGTYWETFINRVKQVYHHKTILTFPLARNKLYFVYNQAAFSDATQKRISSFQNRIPAGESILAFVSMPFLFDFKRNNVYVTPYGFRDTWLDIPLYEGKERLTEYFRQFGIRYIIWQYQGFGMKWSVKSGKPPSQFITILDGILLSSKTVHDDGMIVLSDIGLTPEAKRSDDSEDVHLKD